MRHFINEGYGWTCRRCLAAGNTPQASDADDDAAPAADDAAAVDTSIPANLRARFFHEGEAEGREPQFAAPALARRREASPQTLYCPVCGVEETLDADGAQA